MRDEASFLAALAAAPGGEVLLLAFADWLEERGDPRAAWIRDRQVRAWMGPALQNPIPALVEALTRNKRLLDVRRVCGLIGEPVVPALVELLRDDRPRVRQHAALCLRKVGHPAQAAVAPLLAALKDPDRSVRQEAARALKDIKPAGADTAHLRDALTDVDWTVRQVASQVLGSLGARGDVAQELAQRLRSKDPETRKAAIEALGHLVTAEAIAPLDGMLDDPLPEVRAAAAVALGQLVKVGQADGSLCRALKDADRAVRETAAQQFFQHGHVPAVEAMGPLQAALTDTSPKVRMLAALALGDYEKRAAGAIPDLLRNLTHRHSQVRTAAVRALGNVGRDDPAVLSALIRALEDRDENVNYWALQELGKWSYLPNSAAEPLLRSLRRSRQAGSWNAGMTYGPLSKLETPTAAVIDEMRRGIAMEQETPHACAGLAAIGPPAAAVVPELTEAVRTGGHSEPAVRALLRIGGEGLTRLGQFIAAGGQWEAVLAVLQPAGAEALPLLPAMLRRLRRTRSEWDRSLVVEAIRHLGPGAVEAIPDLVTVAEGAVRGDDRAPSGAIGALANLAGGLEPYFPRLLALSNRPELSSSLRAAFAPVLAQLGVHHPPALDALREKVRAASPASGDNQAVREDKDRFRLSAVQALADIGAAAAPAVPELVAAVSDASAFTRRHAIDALGKVRANTQEALEALRTAEKGDPDMKVRTRAAAALKAIEGRQGKQKGPHSRTNSPSSPT